MKRFVVQIIGVLRVLASFFYQFIVPIGSEREQKYSKVQVIKDGQSEKYL